MRRFITLMAGAMVFFAIGFSSSTAKAYDNTKGLPKEMYLYGEINGKNNWNPNSTGDMVPMNYLGNNTWQVQITSDNRAFKICPIANDGWWYFEAANSIGDNDVSLSYTSKDLQTYNVTNKGAGSAFTFDSTLKEAYITVKWDSNKGITVSVDKYPSTLYLYDADTSFATPFATLTGDGNGKYTVTKTTGTGFSVNQTYKFYISLLATGSTGNWSDHNGKRYTPGSDKNITNPGSMDLSLSDSGTVVYKTEKEGTATFTFTMNSDQKGGKFEVAFEENKNYYLSGDINDWVTDTDKTKLNLYKFTSVPENDPDVNALLKDEDKSQWYVLYLPRIHGQFKIHQGNWNGTNWGCTWTRTKTGVGKYDNMNYTNDKDEIHKYIENSKAAESMPANANLSSGSESYFNVRCSHNYYNNAYIYFNPTSNKLFINGQAEDIYVYYYNGEDAAEKNGIAQIYVRASVVNDNNDHYYYDDRILLNTPMPFETLTDKEMEIPVLKDNVQAIESDGAQLHKCYKIRVSPGLEQPYNAGGKQHSFGFYLEGAKKIGATDTEVFKGHSIYYVFSGVLPAVTFNYTDIEGNEVSDLEIGYRLIAINTEGKPEYIKEDGTRTAKRSEAARYVLDYKLTNGKDGFNPGSGTTWLAVKKKERTNVQSLMAKEAAVWTSQVEPVKAGDVNRYVEFDVKLKDPEPEAGSTGYYHEFQSDFELSADNDADAYVQDGDIDSKAQMTGKLLPGRETNPQYKLNGAHLYAVAQTSVPTGVKELPVDNNEYDDDADVETVYYNLQGVRVTNPDRGIYIMVKGKTSKKVRF